MSDSYFDRLINSIVEDDDGVFARDDDGRLLLFGYRGARFDPPLLFDITPQELEAAVHEAGPDGKAVWPEVPEPEGGFRLFLINVEESLNSTRIPTRRVYIADGQIWAE